MSSQINKRQLETPYVLTVQEITFASDAIGKTGAGGRTSTVAWAQNDTVIFTGKLKHILLFGIIAFDVSQVAILEKFTLTPATQFANIQNLAAQNIVQVVSLDPANGAGIVLDNDVTFLERITNNYRFNWSDRKRFALELKSDAGNIQLYAASVLEMLCYMLQNHATLNDLIYTLYDLAIIDESAGTNIGVTYTELTSTAGPVEIEKAHVTLANTVLGA